MNEVMNTESQLPAEQKLSQLAAEINAIKEQVRETVYLSTCRIGEKLLLAKGAVGHGNWGQWLKDNVDYSERTAQNIITIYKNFNSILPYSVCQKSYSSSLGESFTVCAGMP